MKLNLGYSRVDQIEHVLYVPGIFEIDPDTKEQILTTPIGGDAAPFTLLMRSKATDVMKVASDKVADEVAAWFQANLPNLPAKKRTQERLISENTDAFYSIMEDFVISGVIGWKNAPAVDDSGKAVAAAPYDPEALRQAFRDERELLMQALGAYTPKNSGKFVSLKAA